MCSDQDVLKVQQEIERAMQDLRDGKHDDAGKFIELCLGMDEQGRECWAYVAIQPSKYEEYKRRCAANEMIDIKDFGEVIESGFDALPPKEMQKGLKEKFGLNYHMEQEFRAEIEKHQSMSA